VKVKLYRVDYVTVLQQELMALLGQESFLLLKICSGQSSILEAFPPDCRKMEVRIELDLDEGIKTLGLQWNPLSDPFLFIKGSCIQICESLKSLF
jgi:hypothetical protein